MANLLIGGGIAVLALNGVFQAFRIRKLEKEFEEIKDKGKNPRRGGIVR